MTTLRRLPLIPLLAFLALASARVEGAVIGFEEFGNVGINGPVVTNQYPGVVFSSVGSAVNRVSSQAGIGFGQNFICTAPDVMSSINCAGETIVTFLSPVSGLTLYAVGSDTSGPTAKADVFVNGAFAATQVINTNGLFGTPNLLDLSTFSNVSSIRLYNITDDGGLGWDQFSFTASVPEGGTLLLMMSGLAALMGIKARRS